MTTAKMVGAACLGACVTLVLFLSVDWKNAVSVERWIDQQSPHSSEHEPRIAENSKTKTKPVARTPAKEEVSSGHCSARTNFVFIKVHKAGSSTTTPIVARYALRQNLTVMFPLGRGTLSWPNIPRVNDYVHTPDEKYSVLFHHTVYNKEWMESKFPANTAYLAILREPFSHLKSSFNFYRLDRILPFKDRENPLKEFLRNPAKYHTSGVVQGVLVDNTKNGQAFDMGYPVEKDRDMQYGREYIEQLDRDFTLILILEYLDLSLVMLKRLMCWETRDMLYIKRNSKTYPYKSYQPTEAERAAHRQWSPVEYAMYNHFNQTLWRKINEQGPDFFEELEFFRQVNKQVNDFCSHNKPQTGKDLPTKHIPESPWSDAFDITPNFCTLLGMDYGSIDSLIRTKQGRPILEKPCEQQKVKLKPNLYFVLDGRPGFQTLEDVMKYNPKKSKKPLNHEQSYILGRLTKSFQKCKKKQKGMKDHFHEVAGNFKVKVIQDEMLNFLKEDS
ncbi:galactosylceramide sulfotransferase-like [Branchiostoma floridae]|uniref:Galactosylceramide sulfotransferase-like n=1 Tax=Branchiostoma floridae TaxID=7739 RepID=A0A9J7N4F3_BRAFL|nr:galactosylceramide sulfotransferase-like [Branchiostoma floridae]